MRRPRNIAGMAARMAAFCSPEGFAKGLAYRPDPSDIFISPYAKCGTTWMQQIVHGLRSGGDMDFAEITEVVPWLELAHDLGLDLQAPQRARPHVFKSHLGWDEIPKGGRYIVVLRDPVDAMLSLYRFLDGWFFEAGSVTLKDFATYYLTREGANNYWSHAVSWCEQRDNPDVLLLIFEAMKADLPGTAQRVADFMGGYPEERVALATRQAGFEFMKAHARQFDDNLVRRRRDSACGLPPGGASDKVHAGRAGAGQSAVTAKIRDRMDARWHRTMGKAFGFESYQALCDHLRA